MFGYIIKGVIELITINIGKSRNLVFFHGNVLLLDSVGIFKVLVFSKYFLKTYADFFRNI